MGRVLVRRDGKPDAGGVRAALPRDWRQVQDWQRRHSHVGAERQGVVFFQRAIQVSRSCS